MLTTLAFAVAVGVPQAPAHATVSFTIRVSVAANGGATALLTDTIMPSNRYLLTLSANGGGACGVPGPTVQIVETAVAGYDNPVTAATSGACTLHDASMVYLVTWAGRPGSSGQFPVSCMWVAGTQRCSPTTFNVPAP